LKGLENISPELAQKIEALGTDPKKWDTDTLVEAATELSRSTELPDPSEYLKPIPIAPSVALAQATCGGLRPDLKERAEQIKRSRGGHEIQNNRTRRRTQQLPTDHPTGQLISTMDQQGTDPEVVLSSLEVQANVAYATTSPQDSIPDGIDLLWDPEGVEMEATTKNALIPTSLSPLLFSISDTVESDDTTKDPRNEIRLQTVFQLYLRGYARETVARRLGIPLPVVKGDFITIHNGLLRYMRTNPGVFGNPAQALFLQILRRRDRQSALWDEIQEAVSEAAKPQYYRLIAEEDKAIEGLLGLDRKTLDISIGSPAEQSQAAMLREMGPDALRELLADIRATHTQLTGSVVIDVGAHTVEPRVEVDEAVDVG